MKKLLSILLLFASLGSFAQTLPSVPAGAKTYGTQPYLTNDGNILMGTSALKYRVIPTKARMDSLFVANTITADNGLTKTGNNIQLGGPVTSFTVGTSGTKPTFTMTGSLILARNYVNNDFNTSSLLSGGQASFGAYRANSAFHGLNVAPNSIVINDAYDKKGLSGFDKFWSNLTSLDSLYYIQKGYADAIFAPISGSLNYIRNNNTGTPQAASANINGTFKVDNANGTSYILGGIASFSTAAGVTSIDGGTLDAKKISAGITPSIAGVEMGNGGSASLAYISAKSSDGTPRALNVLSSALNLNGTVTSNDNFSVNGTSTFNQGFTSNGLGTFNTGFKTLNNPNYFVGSASLDFARDNTLVNNIKVKAPIGYTGAHEQQLQAATGTIALTSDLDNLVTLNTIQTISGRKTFTSNMDMQNGEINFTNGSSTYPNSSMFYGGISIKNGVDNYVSIFPNNIYVQKGSGLSTVIGTVQPTGQRTVNFPDASGTIALTSDVSALSAQKGQANGFASLDANGKLLNSQVPALALVDTYVVTSQAAMLALPAEQGDVAIRNDESKTYILQSNPSTTLANWVPLKTPQSPVESVNGQTGIVSLNKADINLGNVDNTSDANKPVSTATQTALNDKLGLTGGTMTGSINASGIDNYGATKIRGNFDGIDAISFNVPTYTTTTNGNAVASTKFVQDRLASGQSIGANAASATVWGGATSDFTTSGDNIYDLVARNNAGVIKPYSFGQVKTALATSWQDVTNVGNATSRDLAIGNTELINNHYITLSQSTNTYSIQSSKAGVGAGSLSLNPSGGNVGIGVTPINKLDVVGNQMSFRNESNDAGLLINPSAFTGGVAILPTNYAGTADKNLLLAPYGGNVGVGTAPASGVNFHVRTGTDQNFGVFSTTDGVSLSSFNDAVTVNKVMRFTASDYNFNLGAANFNSGQVFINFVPIDRKIEIGANAIQASKISDNTPSDFYLNYLGGNVGIGTTNPTVKLDVAGDIKANNLTSGTYTPTVTMGSGLTSNTAHTCHYTRVGNEVTVHGWVEVTASSLSGNTNYSITLPVASNMTSSDDLSGVGQFISSGQGTTKVMGDAANDKAIISVSVQAGVPLPSYFSFTYTIK